MAQPFSSALGHLLRRKPKTTRVWKTHRKPVRPEPRRKPLDKCSVPLWIVLDIVGGTILVPIVDSKTKQKKFLRLPKREITLQNFRGDKLHFRQSHANVVTDLRDNSTMTLGQFSRYVTDKVGFEFTLKPFERK